MTSKWPTKPFIILTQAYLSVNIFHCLPFSPSALQQQLPHWSSRTPYLLSPQGGPDVTSAQNFFFFFSYRHLLVSLVLQVSTRKQPHMTETSLMIPYKIRQSPQPTSRNSYHSFSVLSPSLHRILHYLACYVFACLRI